jgi:CubicO group peptidase (beta-lactamase class C family)
MRRHTNTGWCGTFLALTVVGARLAGPATAEGQGQYEYADAIAEARTLLGAFMSDQAIPGLSVAVGVEGRIVWSEGMGFANLEHRLPVTPLTRFRSGSIAKPMTAAGLAVLYEEARIDLDAPVRQYVPDPAMHATITARQLAGHLSGIRHYPPDGDEFFNARRYTNLLDALEIFRDDSLLFEPGTRYSYSTYGYNLLGAVMQEASGEGFLEFLEHNVFQPIGMRSTVGDHSDSIIPYRTSFYERSGGRRKFVPHP